MLQSPLAVNNLVTLTNLVVLYDYFVQRVAQNNRTRRPKWLLLPVERLSIHEISNQDSFESGLSVDRVATRVNILKGKRNAG